MINYNEETNSNTVNNCDIYNDVYYDSYGGKIHNLKRNMKKKTYPITTKPSNGIDIQKHMQYGTSNSITSQGLGIYKYPSYDIIKAGNYFSVIDNVKKTKTKSGEKAIEVFYAIKPYDTCYKIATSQISKKDTNDTYYIRQKYPIDSEHYQCLVDSMAEALCRDHFKLHDIIGVTEFIKLSYEYSDIGGFAKRDYLTWEEFTDSCIEHYNAQKQIMEEMAEITNKSEPAEEYNTKELNNQEYDEDDEFDDFLDDDDEY